MLDLYAGVWQQPACMRSKRAMESFCSAHEADDTTQAAVVRRFSELSNASLSKDGLRADLRTYNILLKACMRGRDLQRARQVMGWIEAAGLQVTQPQVINIRFKHVLRRHESGTGCAMQGNDVTYNTLITTALSCGDIEEALAALRAMEDAGYQPEQSIWGAVILGCGKVKIIGVHATTGRPFMHGRGVLLAVIPAVLQDLDPALTAPDVACSGRADGDCIQPVGPHAQRRRAANNPHLQLADVGLCEEWSGRARAAAAAGCTEPWCGFQDTFQDPQRKNPSSYLSLVKNTIKGLRA